MSENVAKAPKFLVDLKNRVFLSEKPHQDIIDDNGLDPAGYDNYLKGWVADASAKIWVEQLEDLVFRYWDQAKIGFQRLVKDKILDSKSKTYAIVNHKDTFAGLVDDFIRPKNWDSLADKTLGRPTPMLVGAGALHAGSIFRLLTTVRLGPNRYLPKGVEGKLVKDIHGTPPKLTLSWKHTVNGLNRSMAGTSAPVDIRVLLHLR